MSGKFCPVDGCRHNMGGYCAKENGSMGVLPLGLIPQGGIGGAGFMGQPAAPGLAFLADYGRPGVAPEADVQGSWENCAERKTIRD